MEGPPIRPLERVLVAVDGSEASMKAARVAVDLAAMSGADLTAATVVQVPVAPEYATAVSRDVEDYLAEEAREALARVVPMARREGLDAKVRVLHGHPAVEIARFADKGNFDLLVVGSRGLSGVDRMFLGSVSSALVQQSKVSVLVVK
ncbi:MAG: universal stress protein [Halobacteria archaeon]